MDALELGKPRRTRDGYLAVRARAARVGVYSYSGREVDPEDEHGLRDQAAVNVLRDEGTVFNESAARSFLGKPITVDHPSEPVTAANWKDHARGAIMGALRDGDYLAFDLLLMDAAAIAAVESGKQELSNGYAATLEFGDFVAPDGTKCPVRQAQITDGNHCALVKAGRAGPECRISDGQPDGGNKLFECCDAATVILNVVEDQETSEMPKFITLDGLKVDLSDADAVQAAIEKLQGQARNAQTARETAEASVAALTTDKATLEAKVTTLETQLADAKVTPAQLRDAAAAFAKVQDQAKRLGVTVTDEMDEAGLKKAAVTAKIGDAAKDWTEAQIDTSFATLVAQLGDDQQRTDPIRQPVPIGDGRRAVSDVRAAWLANKQTSYRARA